MDAYTAWRILGLAPLSTPTDDEIKARYYGLARSLHPHNAGDPSPEANRRMVELNLAYQLLVSDEQKKARKVLADFMASKRKAVPPPVPGGLPSVPTSQSFAGQMGLIGLQIGQVLAKRKQK